MKTLTLNEQIKAKGIVKFYSGDVIIIRTTPNMISNTISIIYKNNFLSAEDEYLSIPNTLKVWTFLKKISEEKNGAGHSVSVKVQVWDENEENVTLVDYKDSTQYAYRFGNA